MSYRLQFTVEASNDLLRLYDFLLENDIQTAERARDAIRQAVQLLRDFPFSCRKFSQDDPFLRELLIPFGSSGYVALFSIGDNNTVTVIAVRHQREEDYH